MREVEIKALLRDKAAVVKQLAALGCVLSEPVVQRDIVYMPPGATVPAALGTNVLRLRMQGEKRICTLKRPGINELDCFETEFEVSDGEALLEMFTHLGFIQFTDTTKTRQKGRYKDIEICVDEVNELGSFIEAEKIVADGSNPAEIQEELFQFLKQFGVERTDLQEHGYDVMWYLKHKKGT